MIFTSDGGISFVIEVILAELIFLFGAEKRPHFPLRLLLGYGLSYTVVTKSGV